MTRCYRCLTPCVREVDACPRCGCVAFVGNLIPSWPPTYTIRVPGDRDPHILGGAFLLGPIPKPPALRALSDTAEEREVAKPTRRNA